MRQKQSILPTNWRTVRVFISSTFQDMHDERDHLVKFVFPELKSKLRTHRIHLIDVDLRWGVSEQDAESGRALDICLDEIDACRPYFVCFLGHRYGHIPRGHSHSITAQEVYHGVLHKGVPRQIVDLDRIIDGRFEGIVLTQQQIDCLRRSYCWQADKAKYLILDTVTEKDYAIIREVFKRYYAYQRNRSLFFFRSKSLSTKLSEERGALFFDSDPLLQERMRTLKQTIREQNIIWYEYDDVEAVGEEISELLFKKIMEEDTQSISEEHKTWVESENELQELFVTNCTRHFVGRKDLMGQLHSFVTSEDARKIMLIDGDPGIGKSALLANFERRIAHEFPDWIILSHFVGASPDSTRLRETLYRLYLSLSKEEEGEVEIPDTIEELSSLFSSTVTERSASTQIVLIVDGLNQLHSLDQNHAMRWIPERISGHVKIILSGLSAEMQTKLRTYSPLPEKFEVCSLKDYDIEEMVSSYLGEIRREFPTPEIEAAFFEKIRAGHPLYIKVALEELRLHGHFKELSERIGQFPNTLAELFDQVLQRIESDIDPALVRESMSLIACGRYGMRAEELQSLLADFGPEGSSSEGVEKLPDMMWARLYRAFGSYLFERSEVIDFFHGQLKEAVEARYLSADPDRRRYHLKIAEYFEQRWKEPYLRALDELPYQRVEAGDINGLSRVLMNLVFIEEKCSHQMAWSLMNDFQHISSAHIVKPPLCTVRVKPGEPVQSKSSESVSPGDNRVSGEYGFFCPFCLAWSSVDASELGAIITCPACTAQLQLNTFTIESDWQPTEPVLEVSNLTENTKLHVPEVVVTFADFVKRHIDIIADHPSLTLQQAANEPEDSPLAFAASESMRENPSNRAWFRWRNKPNNTSASEITLRGHTDWVYDCDYSPDGYTIVSVSADKSIRLWDSTTGETISLIDNQEDRVRACTFSPDGQRIATLQKNRVEMWDRSSGRKISSLADHSNSLYACSFSPDGGRIAAGGADKTVKIWDLNTGEVLNTIHMYTSEQLSGVWSLYTDDIKVVQYSPDGSRILVSSGFDENALRVYDSHTGEKLVGFGSHGYNQNFQCAAFSPDGTRVVSVSSKGPAKIWDAWSGELISDLPHFDGNAEACAYSPDGRYILVGKKSLYVWSADSLLFLGTLKSDSASMNSFCFSPDGHQIAAATYNHTLRVIPMAALECDRSESDSNSLDKMYGVSPDGKYLLCEQEGRLNVCSPENGSLIREWAGRMKDVATYNWSPDGSQVILGSGEGDEGFKIFDNGSGYEVSQFAIPKSDTEDDPDVEMSQRVWAGLRRKAQFCHYSPDGSDLLLAFWEPFLRIVECRTGKQRMLLEGLPGGLLGNNRSCCYSPDGRRVVAGCQADKLFVWDADTGTVITERETSQSQCRYSPDGRTMATISHDGGSKPWSVKVWNMRTYTVSHTLYESSARLTDCMFTPDAQCIVAYGDDNIVRMWEVVTGKLIGLYVARNKLNNVIVIKGGLEVVLHSDRDGLVLLDLCNLEPDALFVTATRLFSPLLGTWDLEVTGRCQWCGNLFPVPDYILECIQSLTNHLQDGQSPCEALPDSAWEDPSLKTNCPHCKHPLRFNPFKVDKDDNIVSEFGTLH